MRAPRPLHADPSPPGPVRAAAAATLALFLAASPVHARAKPAPPPAPSPLTVEGFPVERVVLDNGLVVLLHEDHSVPTVTFWQWYRTGSRNERPGITGISHMFEHMMFDGTRSVPPKEYDRIVESNGGDADAFTDRDRTAYVEDIASDRYEVLLRLDADRMRGLALEPSVFESERRVVEEERRQRTDDDIFGMLDEQLYAAAFNASTYRWPVIGWMGDVDHLTRDDLLAYFRTYYAPDNCILALTGDFDRVQALALVRRYFGDIPRQPPPPEPVDSEPVQRGERRVEVHYPAENVTFLAGYKAPDARSPDVPVLEVLGAILSDGESSRLHLALIHDQQIALDAGTSFTPSLQPTLFEVYARLRPGKTADQGVAAMDGTLARLVRDGPTPRELEKAKNLLEADFVRGLETNRGVGEQLAFHEQVFGDYRAMFSSSARRDSVTVEDCRRVAKRVFDPLRRTLSILVPDPPAGAGGEAAP